MDAWGWQERKRLEELAAAHAAALRAEQGRLSAVEASHAGVVAEERARLEAVAAEHARAVEAERAEVAALRAAHEEELRKRQERQLASARRAVQRMQQMGLAQALGQWCAGAEAARAEREEEARRREVARQVVRPLAARAACGLRGHAARRRVDVRGARGAGRSGG